MPRNRRAVISTVLFAVIVAVTGTLVLFLGSAAQAAGRSTSAHAPAHKKVKAEKKAKALTPLQEVIASDAWTGDDFGWSVSISGTTAVVGAPYADSYTGAAYVFTKGPSGWSQAAELTASDAADNEEFGWSVNISGSTIVVGAPGYYFNLGAAYVFTGSGSTWTQAAELNDTDPTSTGADKFGYSVVTSGSTAMVGAKGYSAATGAVYVFDDSGGSWSQVQKLSAADAAPAAMFGWSMALSGTTLVVSAVKAHNDTGADYVFTQSAGAWTQQAELSASDGFTDDYFGDKVATDGTRIVAGAPGHNKDQGAAYVFTGSGAHWTQVAEIEASDGAPDACFGWAVGLAGKTILIGAEQTDADNGAAYVFRKTGSHWRQKHELTVSDGSLANEFGYSVAVSGTSAIVSADQDDAGVGSAYLYKL